MSTSPSIRPLTKADLEAMGVDHFDLTVRGIAAELNGEVVGVAGVLHGSPSQAFSTMDDRLRAYPKTIMRAARQFLHVLSHYDTVYAVASDNEPNSVRFIERIGFRYLTTTSQGRTFRWHKQSLG